MSDRVYKLLLLRILEIKIVVEGQHMANQKFSKRKIPLALTLIFFFIARLLESILGLFKTCNLSDAILPGKHTKPVLDSTENKKLDNNEKYREIIEVVETLKTVGQKVKVKITGDLTSYTSTITAVNREHGMVVIDPFHTDSELELLYGCTIIIEAECQGQKFHLPCSFVDTLVPNFSLGYQLKLS